ncbi:UNVERIFIED_CONTAM: hypothetical protein Slati_1705100 [Sesamum latifolium]|uniref:Reverse transcriptase/retrotransposon-derived protein RNase H-like domain-containing protein n=1 Tax=Sesamum latifolium TaxID=2727402 RepID=A0AAW2WZH5_9LAMI
MVIEKEIKVNLDKLRAIQEMKAPVNLNEVSKLAGHLASVSRFISHSTERSLPFFKALRRTKNFAWNEPCLQDFQDLKTDLAKLPLLTKLSPGEPLYLYLVVDNTQ